MSVGTVELVIISFLSRRYLSLSTNIIDRMSNLGALSKDTDHNYLLLVFSSTLLENLKILALGRNNIKSLSGIEALGETLEQLWISYNLVDKLRGIGSLKKLRVLYMGYNMVKDWAEYARLNEVVSLEEICFFGKLIQIHIFHRL